MTSHIEDSWKSKVERALGCEEFSEWEQILYAIGHLHERLEDADMEVSALRSETKVLNDFLFEARLDCREAEGRIESLRTHLRVQDGQLVECQRQRAAEYARKVAPETASSDSLLRATAKCVKFLMANSSSHTMGLRGSSARDESDALAQALVDELDRSKGV